MPEDSCLNKPCVCTVEFLFYTFGGTVKWCVLQEMVFVHKEHLETQLHTIYIACNLQSSLPFYLQVFIK
jgi:hypothetical protein